MSLKAQIQTPNSKDDRSDLKVEEIPLPPEALWAELDNSDQAKVADTPSPKPAAPADDRIVLEFLAGDISKVVPLSYPFRFEGKEVREITVRRLSLGDVQALLRKHTGQSWTLVDIYAEMTGFPAPVLRGMMDEDGTAVTDAAYDFLPQRLLQAFDLSEN